MSMTKDMWMDAVESVIEEFSVEKIDLPEAIGCLIRMGLDADEAETMLKEAIS